ncbi:MAG: hypothetical protein K8U03_02480 [Planctomycetia bacterium]|nr:hypothetical protein [Planctomycetia bacterium]
MSLSIPSATNGAEKSASVAEVYAWFDTLELPDVRKLPFVEIRFVVPRDDEGKNLPAKRYRSAIEGFVTAEDESSISLFTYDLYRLKIPRSEIIATADGRSYRPLKIETAAERLLARIKLHRKRFDAEAARRADFNKPAAEFSDEELITLGLDSNGPSPDAPTSVIYRHDLHPKIDVLLTAWLCKQLGDEASRQLLEEQVPHLPEAGYVNTNRPQPTTLRDEVMSGIELDYFQRMMQSLVLPQVTWNDVSAQCEWIARRFPKDLIQEEHFPFFARVKRMLTTMRPAEECRRLDAEIAAVRKASGPWKAEHAEYLVYSLRHGRGWIEYEEPREMADLRRCGKVGLAAMIDHVDDDTPTRYVGTGHRFNSWLSSASIGHLIWFELSHGGKMPNGIEFFEFNDPPEARAALKAKLRKLLLTAK